MFTAELKCSVGRVDLSVGRKDEGINPITGDHACSDSDFIYQEISKA